ncbi:MAG: N-acetylmuramoyl-L-alanine amidase [Nitrospiraceae bacterium]|nr:N-acetylmuramoyl-L-alanine amidase [Nitrospiraceae bacterium]
MVILLCLVGWLGIPGAWVQPVSAATAGDRERYSRTSTSKHHRVKGTSASLAPATIHNFRVLTSPQKTRLVIDLDRHTKVIEHLAQNPSRVVLALRNAAMDSSAHVKAVDGTVPAPFSVMQTATPSVFVSLPTGAVRTYKHFTLTHPPRLVVDITPPIDAPQIPVPEASAPPLSAAPLLQPVAPPAKGYTTIVIDPGHGGKDPGARGLRHTEEKDITLKVGLRLRELLNKQPRVRVLMTREQDVFVELEERAKFANKHEADLFVSIHVNSHPSRAVKGIEIYHFGQAKDQRALEVAARENGTPLNSTGVGWEYLVADLLATKKLEASLELAWTAKEAMVAHMNGHYALNDHGVKTAPFYVLRFTSMPSILAEIAYISNPAEEALLRTPAFVRDVAESLFQGVQSFLSSTQYR